MIMGILGLFIASACTAVLSGQANDGKQQTDEIKENYINQLEKNLGIGE